MDRKNSNNNVTGIFFQKHGIITDLLLITFLWCLAAIIVNPHGDFPITDDSLYGKTVKHLIDEGEYRPPGRTPMTLITQVLWGAAFCVLFGFSFTTLRFSTLLLSLFGIFGFYLLIRHLKCPRWLAVIVALMLSFNPVYFALSYSFMTDVPFTVLTVFAALLLLKSLQSNSNIYLFLGAVMAVAATLCRQIGLFIPAAFGLALMIRHGISLRFLPKAAFPLVVAIGSLFIFQKWLEIHGVLPSNYNNYAYLMPDLLKRLQSLRGTLLFSVLKTYEALLNLGLFLFPLVILTPMSLPSDKSLPSDNWSKRISIGIFLLPIVFYLFRVFKIGLMPLTGPVLFKGGIGPITLYDTFTLGLPHAPTLPRWFWMLVTIVSLLGAGLVLTSITRVIIKVFNPALKQRNSGRVIAAFFIFGAVLYFMPITVIGFPDRYLIPLIPVLAAAIIWERNDAGFPIWKPGIKISIFVLGLFVIYSIVGTRDYLQLNRVRWDALQYLMEQEAVKPSQIDGGFEFNEMYMYMYSSDSKDKPLKRYWVYDDEYIVTLGEIPGYEIFKQYSFSHWMSMQKVNLYILRRSSTATEQSALHSFNSSCS